MPGRSYWPHLIGASDTVHPPTDSAGWVLRNGNGGALIRDNQKIINVVPGGLGATAWRLYDLSADPGERNDLAGDFSELNSDLVAEWEENWR